MQKYKIIYVLLISVLWVMATSLLNAQDWTGWRGPNRDGKVVNFKIPEKWPDQLKLVWQVKVGLGDASPVMYGSKLFLFTKIDSSEVVSAIDSETGTLIWKTVMNIAPEVTGGAHPHPGPRSTPAIFDNRIYTQGVGGHIHCLDIKSGKIIWENDTFKEVPQFFTSSSPLVVNGLCIIHVGGKNGEIVAFNIKTGEIEWKNEKEPATYSSPVFMRVGKELVIVVQTETDLAGISLKGETLWKFPTPGEQRFYNSTTPVIDGNTIYVAGQGKGTVKLEIMKDGNKWNVTESWRNKDFGGSYNTPVLIDGFLYGNEARLGKHYCLNANTGATAWADTIGYNRFSATFNLGKIVLSQPANGKLVFYEANPDKYVNKAIYKVSDTEIYASPVLTGKRIFIKDKENLTCFSLE